MFITILKFLHVIIALSLMGLAFYSLVAMGSKRIYIQPNKILFYLSLIAIVTGTFLVHPRHFHFHTPWIQAAYVLALLFTATLMLTKKNKLAIKWQRLIYLILIIILLAITHDAVTKTTFLL